MKQVTRRRVYITTLPAHVRTDVVHDVNLFFIVVVALSNPFAGIHAGIDPVCVPVDTPVYSTFCLR